MVVRATVLGSLGATARAEGVNDVTERLSLMQDEARQLLAHHKQDADAERAKRGANDPRASAGEPDRERATIARRALLQEASGERVGSTARSEKKKTRGRTNGERNGPGSCRF